MFWLLNFIMLGIVSAQESTTTNPATPITLPPTSATVPPTPATVPPTPATVPPTSATVPPTPATVPPTPATVPPTPATVTPTPATVPPTPATVPPTTKESGPVDDIDQKLRDIIRTYEAECQGNPELTSYLNQIRFALKLGNEYSAVKNEALTNFKVYNAIRLLLDKRITERIDTLNDLLPTLTPNGRCSQFYLRQRKNLKEVEKLSNAEKQARLTENSVVCPNAEDDYNEDDYIYIDDLFTTK